MMKIGCFGSVKQVPLIAEAGFDSAELDICELCAMDEGSFRRFRECARASGLEFEAFSGFMPLTERIHSPDFQPQRWYEHARRAAQRTAELGAVLWPFGAGKCRSIPQGMPREEGEKRVLAFVEGLCDILEPYHIVLAIEPLGPANSNYLNFIGEAAAFAERLGRGNCRVMCDLRHMYKLSESVEDVVTYREIIRHAHIDYPRGERRLFPHAGDGFDYRPYLEALERSGYQGLLTVEATAYEDFLREARRCAEYLHLLGV